MSDAEVLEELIKRARETKERVVRLSDAAHVLGGRFVELGRALERAGGLRQDFPFEYCDVAKAESILKELPDLQAELGNLESRVKRRTAID